ncbi:MAG: hypothetical protein B7X40_07895, partial [Cellulomonas sp. 14-74-6]
MYCGSLAKSALSLVSWVWRTWLRCCTWLVWLRRSAAAESIGLIARNQAATRITSPAKTVPPIHVNRFEFAMSVLAP